MKKMTRMFLISAVFVTSGLTAKIAHENYKAVVTNDERIHTAHENLKKPNKAAVLETIVDATNAESEERIQNAVVLEPEEPKVPKVVRVTTSAGVSPIVPTMDKKTVNKAEEFIEKVAHPAEVVTKKNLDFTTENIPVQELTYEIKDIFPEFDGVEEFEEVEEIILPYRIKLPNPPSYYSGWSYYLFDVNAETKLNGINVRPNYISIEVYTIQGSVFECGNYFQAWRLLDNNTNVIKYDAITKTLDYSSLVEFKDSNRPIHGYWSADNGFGVEVPTCKEVYDFLSGVENGKYPLLPDMHYS